MATYTVTTLADEVKDDGELSLREALVAADATPAVADTITFDLTAMGGNLIVLTGSQLTVNSDITIDGGAGVTIDADEKSRVLRLDGSATDVTLEHIGITGGRFSSNTFEGSGGGIDAAGSGALTIIDCAVYDNAVSGQLVRGGGIFGNADMDILVIDTEIADNQTDGFLACGGGIYALGHLEIVSSTILRNISNNGLSHGGGIFTASSARVEGSTISENYAGGSGSKGGGIYAKGAIEIVNSSIVGNSTNLGVGFGDGGGIYIKGSIELRNSTVTGNTTSSFSADGGGISLYTNLDQTVRAVGVFSNSIVAGNSVLGPNSTGSDIAGAISASNGHNAFGTTVSGAVAGDTQGVSAETIFALVDTTTGGGQLSDNGGSTPTVALRDAADNPALAGADPADAPATDQRGVARPLPASTAPDIGAFELDQTTGGGEILGTARADTLRGTAAADVIRGLAGDDLLKGLAGDDRLYGDGGDDRLQGNQGVDLLTGGRGCDRFVYRSLADAPASGPGYDEILDFSRPEHDRIDVSPLDAKTDVAGNQAFAFVRQVEFSAAGQLRYEAAADGGFLVEGNVDRNLDADFAFVVHTDLASLKASDFLL